MPLSGGLGGRAPHFGQFILFISTNHLPYISDQTLFKSGRVRVIPIERSFSEAEQDKTLIDRLRQPQELSGILNWLLEGLAAYRREGLQPPDAVVNEVKNYERNSDKVIRFMEDCTEQELDGAVQTSTLHTAFLAWCAGESASAMSKKAFTSALKERGYEVKEGRHNGSAPLSHVWGVKCTFSSV